MGTVTGQVSSPHGGQETKRTGGRRKATDKMPCKSVMADLVMKQSRISREESRGRSHGLACDDVCGGLSRLCSLAWGDPGFSGGLYEGGAGVSIQVGIPLCSRLDVR